MLSRFEIIKVMWRSFFLQAAFNLERYQNIGFLYSLASIINRYIVDRERRKEIFKRHLEIFNTQPYMASFVIGNIAKMEIDKQSEKDITTVKQSLASTYASIGDRLFWSRLKVAEAQATLLIAVILYYCCNESNNHYFLWIAALVPTLFYASYSLYIRYIGIKYGFECGGKRNCGLDLFNWNGIIKTLSRILFFLAVVCMVVILFLYGFSIIKQDSLSDFIYLVLPVVAFAVQRYFRKNRKSILYPIIAMVILSFVFAIFTR